MSYIEVPPDIQASPSIANKTRGETTDIRIEQETECTEVVRKVTESHTQMNSATEKSADKLKEIIQGKLERKRLLLKRKLMALKSENRVHQKELNKLKQAMFQNTVQIERSIELPEIGISSDTNRQAQTDSMSTDRVRNIRQIPLPPVPQRTQIPKPTVGINTSTTNDLPTRLQKLLQSRTTLSKPMFKFNVSDEAAAFNMRLLRDNNFELGRLLNQTKSVTSYGSEFKSPIELEPLL